MTLPAIRTDLYQFSHGRPPRGRGYWAFELMQPGAHGGFERSTVFAPGEMLYSDACRWLRAQYKGRPVDAWRVAP